MRPVGRKERSIDRSLRDLKSEIKLALNQESNIAEKKNQKMPPKKILHHLPGQRV